MAVERGCLKRNHQTVTGKGAVNERLTSAAIFCYFFTTECTLCFLFEQSPTLTCSYIMENHLPSSLSSEEIKSTTLESLVLTIRQRILNGEFEPGSFLRDIRMAEEHGVSRTTFRSAAQILVSQGLLVQIVNRGFCVPKFGPNDIVDVTRLRGVLEGEAVRMITYSGLIPKGALDAIEVMRAAPAGASSAYLSAADRAFHRAIIDASLSPRLQKSYSVLEGEIELLMVQRNAFYENSKELVAEHEHLIRCLETRVYDIARDAFVEHWEDLSKKLLLPT
nr:GntR family transcriptional regulator [Tatumella sp. JGM118]